MRKILSCSVLFFMFFFGCCLLNVSAQDVKKKPAKNFDVNDPALKPYLPDLTQYIQCRAAVKNDIRECDKLDSSPENVKVCRQYFLEYHAFFARAAMKKKVTSDMLEGYSPNRDPMRKKNLEGFLQGWLSDDTTICKTYPGPTDECIAMIKGDETLCSNNACINKSAYSHAIKHMQINDCNKIPNPMVKAMCMGYISGQEKKCEECKDFQQFIKEHQAIVKK